MLDWAYSHGVHIEGSNDEEDWGGSLKKQPIIEATNGTTTPVLLLSKLTNLILSSGDFFFGRDWLPSTSLRIWVAWFASLGDDVVKIDQGQVVSHASGILHGGHDITSGKLYILVAFVILEGYDSWSMRFYNQIRNI